MATIAELDGYRFETLRGAEPFVRLTRKSDKAHIDYGLDYAAAAELLWDHAHGSIDRARLRSWADGEEEAARGSEVGSYWKMPPAVAGRP